MGEIYMAEKKISEYKRKQNTVIFAIVTGLLNIGFMLALMFSMFVIFTVIVYRLMHCTSPVPVQLAIPVIMIAGFALDFILSTKLIRLLIIKFNLADKINKKVADQYLYDKKHPKSES